MIDWSSIIVGFGGSAVTLAGYIIVDRRSKKNAELAEKSKKDEALDKLQTEIFGKLEEHRTEYLEGIDNLKKDISDIKAAYKQHAAIFDIKIDTLEKKQDTYNNVITRVFNLEAQQKVIDEQIKVANNRIKDLEKKS